MIYTFSQLQAALSECTGYYLVQTLDEDGEPAYALMDGCGDQDGELFSDLEEVTYYITNNAQVEQYLAKLASF